MSIAILFFFNPCSNWTLDPAKMNRAVCLQRPDPSELDVHLTGQRIMGLTSAGKKAKTFKRSAADGPVPPKLGRSASAIERLTNWLEPLAAAYHEVYTQQDGRDFIGMRVYYQLLKLLKSELSAGDALSEMNAEMLEYAICRNFGGKPGVVRRLLAALYKRMTEITVIESLPSVTELCAANLRDFNARHLMLLTQNGSAVKVMFASGLLDPSKTMVLVGSQFRNDRTELYLVQQINAVKVAMAAGQTVILHDHDNM